jgi:hypothetical protein
MHDKHAGEVLKGSKVIIAPGHSAREMYKHLADIGVKLEPKPFSVGFRIEHPQALVDTAQYGEHIAAQVQRGRGKVPVADYRLAANVDAAQLQQVLRTPPETLFMSLQSQNITIPQTPANALLWQLWQWLCFE